MYVVIRSKTIHRWGTREYKTNFATKIGFQKGNFTGTKSGAAFSQNQTNNPINKLLNINM